MKKNIIFLSLVFYLYFVNNSYAYLDPVSGGFIIQGLLALIAAIIFYIRNPKRLFQDAINLISKLKKKIHDKISKNKKI